MNPIIFSRSYAVSKIESGCFPKGAYVISFFDSSNKREAHIDFSSTTNNCLYFDYNQIVCLDTAEIRTNSYLQQELLKLSQFIFAAFKEDQTIICQCETGKTISAACAAAIQQEFNQHGIEGFANIDYSPDKRVYNFIREALLEYEIKRAMHQDRRRLHGIQESIQEYVTVCNHPHALPKVKNCHNLPFRKKDLEVCRLLQGFILFGRIKYKCCLIFRKEAEVPSCRTQPLTKSEKNSIAKWLAYIDTKKEVTYQRMSLKQ